MGRLAISSAEAVMMIRDEVAGGYLSGVKLDSGSGWRMQGLQYRNLHESCQMLV